MPIDPIIVALAAELNIPVDQVAPTVVLLDEGNTIPFIARYRKEVTGGLDEEQLRQIEARLGYLRNLAERKATVLRSIAEQGKLTPELEAQIHAAATLQAVEDLYLPYRLKPRTRATIARERGLEPLAQRIRSQEIPREKLAEIARAFLNDEVPTAEDALAGARDIVAEEVSEDAEVRAAIRKLMLEYGVLVSSLAAGDKDPGGKYQLYYEYNEALNKVPPHRLLAINRGDKEGVLRVRIDMPEEDALATIRQIIPINRKSLFAEELRQAIADGYKRLLEPAIERESRSGLTEIADDHAIKVFSANLKNLLLQPPLRGKRVLGIDPGIRTGCKVTLVNATGKFLGGTTIYPHEPQKAWNESKEMLKTLVQKGQVDVIAIGNGTASRETEQLVAEVIQELAESPALERQLNWRSNTGVAYAIVNEAGASVYSASPLARQELPDLDVSMRGAVSIARRLQDPLAELVKIDPKSIGVGLYQHDVDQKQLAEALDGIVESAVNRVGVDLNTASPALLRYVSGLTAKTASAIVSYRDEHGAFKERQALLKVKGLGPKTFEQSAGFLKIPDGSNPLENTFIHPESYGACERLFTYMGVTGRERDLPQRIHAFREQMKPQVGAAVQLPHQPGRIPLEELAALLDVGAPTLADILHDKERSGRDPRDELPPPVLRRDVLSIDDLREGMMLKGTVRNVVDFGAFVDIGVKQDGLVHVSQMADKYVRNPLEVVQVGDVVEVRVIKIDKERGRIGLSMKKT